MAGVLTGDPPAPGDATIPFMPYRSQAHLRLGEALRREGLATVELRGPGLALTRVVTAMTARSITFAPAP